MTATVALDETFAPSFHDDQSGQGWVFRLADGRLVWLAWVNVLLDRLTSKEFHVATVLDARETGEVGVMITRRRTLVAGRKNPTVGLAVSQVAAAVDAVKGQV